MRRNSFLYRIRSTWMANIQGRGVPGAIAVSDAKISRPCPPCGCAWIGHDAIEKNHAATFKDSLDSLLGDAVR